MSCSGYYATSGMQGFYRRLNGHYYQPEYGQSNGQENVEWNGQGEYAATKFDPQDFMKEAAQHPLPPRLRTPE